MNADAARQVLRDLVDQVIKKANSVPENTEEAVNALLELLQTAPGSDLRDLKLVNRKEHIGSLLIKFGELSKFGKQEWLELIRSFGLKMTLNPRDSARDVMGKLARHLRDNPNELSVASAIQKSAVSTGRGTKRKRPLAENLQDTLSRLLDE